MSQDTHESVKHKTKGLKKRAITAGGVAAFLLAVAGGIVKNADNVLRPLMRNADNMIKPAVRRADDAGRFVAHSADEAIKEMGQVNVDVPAGDVKPERHPVSGKTTFPRVPLKFGASFRDMRAVFGMRDDGYYHLTENCAILSIWCETARKEYPRTTSTKLPAAADGEYHRRQLRQTEDGRTIMVEEARLAFDGGRFLDRRTEFQLEFVEGDWSRFTEGGDVVLRFSETAMRENESRFMEDFSAYLLNDRPVDVEDCFFLERGGHHYEAVDGIELLLFWPPTIVANKDFIRSTVDGPVVLKFKVK